MNIVPEKLRSWHNNLTEKSRLFYYGVLGNLSLAALDLTASLAGGQGSIVNWVHNGGDIASYGLRALVASNKLSEKASKRLLLGANSLALSLTGWITIKSGFDFKRQHNIEASAPWLESVSSLGNFAIASGLDDDNNHNTEGHNHHNNAIKDGHRHAKTDAWAGLVAAGGLSLASLTGDSRLDSLGALAGGAYFIWHMSRHMLKQNDHDHTH